jgi:hypothetical protein
LFLIPEVEKRIEAELGLTGPSQQLQVDIPAWLLINSMRLESMQFVQMSMQELNNVWRKRAMKTLTGEVQELAKRHTSSQRLRRFTEQAHDKTPEDITWHKQSIGLFREVIGFPVPDCVPVHQSFSSKLRALVEDNRIFTTEAGGNRVQVVLSKVRPFPSCSPSFSLSRSLFLPLPKVVPHLPGFSRRYVSAIESVISTQTTGGAGK